MKSERNLICRYEKKIEDGKLVESDEYVECYEVVITLDNGKQLFPCYEVKAMWGEWLREWDFESKAEAILRGVNAVIDEGWVRVR